jgi:two-component system KDP operon response regulator KdpE
VHINDFIITQVWGGKNESDASVLRTNMANIRRKIEDNPADPRHIFTQVGVGYRMAEPDGNY